MNGKELHSPWQFAMQRTDLPQEFTEDGGGEVWILPGAELWKEQQQVMLRCKHEKVKTNVYFCHGHTVCKFSGKSPLSSHKTTLKQQING